MLVCPLYVGLSCLAWEQRGVQRGSAPPGYVLPSGTSSLLVLEHKGIASDYLLLRAITFYGERLMYRDEMSQEDWRYMTALFEAVTDLDPYFSDAYLLAESILTWEAGKVDAANTLLRKGMKVRKDDWNLPFYLGANHLLFLKDNETAARFLMTAAEMPGAPNFIGLLAARISYYSGDTQLAILFLEGLLAETKNVSVRNRLILRRKALLAAGEIEDALSNYRDIYGVLPSSLDVLVTKGVIDVLPKDPYGGGWLMLENGRVFSSSKFVENANFSPEE